MHYVGDFMVAEQDEIEVPREIDRKGWLARRGRQHLLRRALSMECEFFPDGKQIR